MLALLGTSIQFLSATTSTTTSDLDTNAEGIVGGVTALADSISKNGPVIVICAVFIMLFILIFLLFLKINNTMFKNMIDQINSKNQENSNVTQKLLNHVLEDDEDEEETKNDKEKDKENEDQEHHHSKDLVGLYIDYTTAFKRESKNVINTLRCDRVAVYVFHNGNQALYGLPFIKMSCVYEDTIKGNMTVRGKTHMNLPLHLFNDFIENLYRDGEFAGNIDDIEIHDNSIREFLAFSDAKAVFMRAIKKSDGSLAGFTACEFAEHMNFADEETYKSISNAIKEMNIAIRYIITDENFAKKYEQQHHIDN